MDLQEYYCNNCPNIWKQKPEASVVCPECHTVYKVLSNGQLCYKK